MFYFFCSNEFFANNLSNKLCKSVIFSDISIKIDGAYKSIPVFTIPNIVCTSRNSIMSLLYIIYITYFNICRKFRM